MDRATALKKLGKLLGKDMGYRVDPKAPTQDEREAARADLIASLPAFEKLKEAREARLQAIIAADHEYQRLKTDHETERERRGRLNAIARHYKIIVGISRGMFFSVTAEGDSWEQIIAKVAEKRPA